MQTVSKCVALQATQSLLICCHMNTVTPRLNPSRSVTWNSWNICRWRHSVVVSAL